MPEREEVRHEHYLGNDIRSSPFKVQDKWKVRIIIYYPVLNQLVTTEEYLDEHALYVTQNDAHTAGFEKGRRLFDEWLLRQVRKQ